ncbi:DUF4345 family protein [Pseudomonas oryzae]|uniref:DUF4345 domain-containing protein n=1 Tax=Pseudomonas oryzae TaxID=1392877 RepID=A0A1H1WNG6_9PSED|nr:DUF4345 family protein [Pseudomonas oryzae]SDS97709.1 protein of unknown function [Pseudomonas oryzae]
MLLARLLLIVQAFLLAAWGLACLLRPHEMVNLSGLLPMEAAAVTDVRAWYGGLAIGLALYLLLALREGQLRPALLLMLLVNAAPALARLLGLGLDGGAQQTFNLYALLLEAVAAGLAWVALRRL